MSNKDLDEALKKNFASTTVSNGIKLITNAVNNVIALDNSLTELSKTADLSSDELSKIMENAYELGESLSKTGTDVLDTVTAFKQAGYDIADSMKYAEETLKTTNISDNLKDSGEAASSLIAIMKGFREESPEFAQKINDAVSHVSDTEAIDFDSLIDGAVQLSEAANQAGMSFEQMLGTLTGGYEVLGNMEEVVSGQLSIFSNLQPVSPDGSYDTSAIEGLQEAFSSATDGAVNIVDRSTGQLRGIYDILDDTADIWNQLDANTKDALAAEAAGSAQKDVFAAMMQNWQGVEAAVESAKNSFGSADRENGKYISSLQGKIDNFSASAQQLSQTLIDSDLLKFFVDFGTGAVSALDKIINKVGGLSTLLGAGSGIALNKMLG